MPNQIDLFRQLYSVSSNPLNKLHVDANKFVGELPAIVKAYEAGQEAFLNVLNNIIIDLNNLFGINLPDATTLVNNIKALLAGFNYSTGALSFLRQLIAALGGSGSLLSDFFNAVSALAGGAQALIDAIANALGHPGTGHTLLQLIGYLETIPLANILSIFGLANLGADIQAIVDKIVNALGLGGVGHGLADLLAMLQVIPALNILAPTPPTPPVFDAAAFATVTVNTSPLTWTHTVVTSGADVFALVDIMAAKTVTSISCGGTPMTLVPGATLFLNNVSTNGQFVIYRLSGVSSGAKAMSAVFSTSAFATAVSVSYTGVTTVATVSTAFGSSNAPSQALTCTSNQIILSGLAGGFVGGVNSSASAPSGGTLRENVNSSSAGIAEAALVVQDSVSNATFSDTLSTSTPWAAIGLAINGTGNGAFPFLRSLLPSILGGADLLADVQAIVDKILNAWGVGGSGHSLATLLATAAAIPNTVIQAVLGGSSLGADIGAIATTLFGSHTTAAHILSTAVASIFGLANFAADVQTIVDFVHQAVNGGSATGNPVTALLTDIEQHNVALPVVLDFIGAGGTAASLAINVPVTGTHTIGAYNNEVLLVAVTFALSGGFSGHVRTAKWTPTGGSSQNMLSLGAINSGGSTGATAGWVEMFYLLNPATTPSFSGTVSVAVNTAVGSAVLESISYGNVNNVTSMTTNSSNTNATSFTTLQATIPDTSTIVSAICASQSITSVTTPAVQRALTNFSSATLAGNLILADLAGTSAGAANLQALVGHTSTSASWGNVQVVLAPGHTHQIAYQSVVDSIISNLIPGGASLVGNDAAIIGQVLSAIPPINIAGYGGPASIDQSHQALWDAAVQAIMGVGTTGHSIADVFNAFQHLSTTANAAYSAGTAKNNVQVFNTSGTYTIPAGMTTGNHFDIFWVPGGGGGAGGQYPGSGNGGTAGVWNAITLLYGTAFPITTTTMTVTVGAGGTAGAASGGSGGTGGTTSIAITGYASSPLTTSGGAGGVGINFFPSSAYIGAGPGNKTFNGNTYAGGAAQNNKSTAGNSPGGAGAGGIAVLGQAGGAGAPGAVIIIAYT